MTARAATFDAQLGAWTVRPADYLPPRFFPTADEAEAYVARKGLDKVDNMPHARGVEGAPMPKKTPTLGERLKKARFAKGKPDNTLRAAGEAMGVSHSIVARWETGEVVPQERHLGAIAEYLGLAPETVARLREGEAGG